MDTSSFSGKKDSIFEVMPDEAAFSLHFKSDLLSKNPSDVEKPLVPPSESVIVDIITDPAVFTRMSTPVEAWRGVITPLFEGTEETKPFLHQVLNEFFKFLKERESIFLEIEDKETEFNEFQKNERQCLISSIYSEYNSPYPFLDYSVLEKLTNTSDINKIIPDKHYFLPNPIYNQTTKKIITNLLTRNSYFNAHAAIKWGFFACDIGSILNGLLFFIRSLSPSSRAQGNPSTLNLPNFSDILPRLSLENASFLPISNENERSISKIIGYRKPILQARSTIVCNGHYVYVLGYDSRITRVSLSNYDAEKFRNFTVSIEGQLTTKNSPSDNHVYRSSPALLHTDNNIELFITSSNGYMLISGSNLIDHECIYSLEPFVKCSGKVMYKRTNLMFKSPKIAEPVASDGQYIYSLFNCKQINVFSLSFQEIIFCRSIELKKGYQELNKKYPVLIPKNWPNDAIMYTNGVILSFLVCKPIKDSEYQYFVRHFSLLNGCHIEDIVFHLNFAITAISYDPWNRCQWILWHNGIYESSLIKMPADGSLPPWMTGVNYEDVSTLDLKKTLSSFSSIRNNVQGVQVISDFLSYFMCHLAGSSFRSQRTGTHVITAQFFGLSTVESLVAAVESIASLISLINNNSKIAIERGQINKTLSALVYFLQYNLSNNFLIMTFEEESLKTLSLRIIQVLNYILNNESLKFLHVSVSLTLITSFSVLFRYGYNSLLDTFSTLYKKMFSISPDLIFFAIQYLTALNLFEYSFSQETYGNTIIPILNKLIKNNVPYPSVIYIFISKLQFCLVSEMRRIVIVKHSNLTEQQENLRNFFFNYSQSLIECMTAYLETPTDYLTRLLPNSVFVALFRKWLMLVHPLCEYKKITHTLLFYIHNLMSKFISVFKQCHSNDINLISPDKKGFDFVYYIFFEIYTAYIDFMRSDFNSSIDLNEVMKYLFFINATLKTKINERMISDVLSILIDDSTSQNNSILSQKKAIISKLDGFDEKTIDIYLKLLSIDEDNEISMLFDFLYLKPKINLSKRLTNEERYTERIIFAAMMKQFKFADEVLELINQLKNNESPKISTIIHHTMEFIYRIRRELQQSRQKTIQANERQNQNKESSVDEQNNLPLAKNENTSSIDNIELLKLKENYPKYIKLLKEKCIFLICINPLFNYDENNFESIFSKAKKLIQNLILNKYGAQDCFKFIDSTEIAKESIATGLNLLNEILRSEINITYSTYMISRFIASRRIITYITTYQMISDKPGKSTQEFIFHEIDVMLSILCNMIIDIPEINLSNSLMIFYSKFILALQKCNYKLAFKSIKHMIKHLFIKRNEIAQAHYSTSLSLISSCLFILMTDEEKDENVNKSLEKQQLMESLKEIIYNKNELIDPELLSITKLLLYSGMTRPFNTFTLLEYLKDCDINYYHSGFHLLADLIHEESPSDKKKIFDFILNEIGTICCGGKTVFMNKMKLINEIDLKKTIINNNDNKLRKIKTPNLILNVCNYLILVCRSCLVKDVEITTENRVETRNTLINLFNEIISQIFDITNFTRQVAVFAVLSNSINSFRKNSIFKFITNNSIYYISDININDQAFFCWHLPIHEKSKPRWISRTNELLPISFLPFTPEMYDQKTLLIPFFKHALTKNSSYKDTLLNFFVLSSLTSYLSSKDFVQAFIKYISKISKLDSQSSASKKKNNIFNITRITFSENKEMFIYLLNQHLTQKSSGFLHINKPEPYFHLISPADILSYSSKDTSSKSIYDKGKENLDFHFGSNSNFPILINRKEIKFNKNNYLGFHSFATSVLHMKQPSFLEIDFNENLGIGVHCFSINQNLSSLYLVSGVTKRIIFNSYPIKRIPKMSSMNRITIEFNPLSKRATVFDNNSLKIHSIKMSSSMACFVIYSFSNKKTIKYKLSHIPAQRSMISSDAAKYLCPFSGQFLFKRQKRPVFNKESETEEKKELDEFLKMFPVKTINDNFTNPSDNAGDICFKQNMSDSMFEQIDDLKPTKFYSNEENNETTESNQPANNNNNNNNDHENDNNDNENNNLNANDNATRRRRRHSRRKSIYIENIDKNPFLIYPQSILQECSGSLNIKKLIDIENFPIRIIHNKSSIRFSRLENSSNISTITQIPVYYSTHSSNTFSLLSRFDDKNDNLIKIDSMNGDVLPLTEKLWPVFQLMPIHPINYHILTTELINFFATGYVTNYRHESINRIFYRAFSLNIIPIPSLLELFSFDQSKLLEYTIYLILYIEPIKVKMISECISPIDFNMSILDQNSTTSSKYHQKKLAVNSIFSYFEQKEIFPKIIKKWFKLLQKQFQDFGCHFVSSHHPLATIVPSAALKESSTPLSSEYTVLKATLNGMKFIRVPLASQLIVFKSGFSHNSPVVANVQIPSKSTNSIDSVDSYDSLELSNNIILVEGDSVIITSDDSCTLDDFGVIILPIFSTSNESLFDSFFNFIVSIKYFVIFLSKHLTELSENNNENDALYQKIYTYRTKIYEMFIDSFLMESPFFFNFAPDILTFFQIKLPLNGSDQYPEFTMKLMLLATYTDIKKFPIVENFLKRQQTMWDERMVIPLKLFFPEFLSNSDKSNISAILNSNQSFLAENENDNENANLNSSDFNTYNNFGLPSPPIPDLLDLDSDLSQATINIKRAMKPRSSIVGYPFHLIIQMWAYYAALLPPFKYKVLSKKLIKVKFSNRNETADDNCKSFKYSPSEVEFICGLQIKPKVRYAFDKEMTNGVTEFSKNCRIYLPGEIRTVFIEMQDNLDFSTFHFAFRAVSTYSIDNDISASQSFSIDADIDSDLFAEYDILPPDLFIKKYREKFISDLKKLVEIGTSEDEKLLSCFPISKFLKDEISLKIDPILLLKEDVDFRSVETRRNQANNSDKEENVFVHSYCDGFLPLLCLRSSLLLAFNWLLYNDKISFDDNPALKPLCHSMSLLLSIKKFNQLIDAQSNDEQCDVTVDRKIGLEVRSGTSDKLSMTIIAQVSRMYKNSQVFRCRGDKPWKVTLVDESGFDAGGPGREVLSEISNDIASVNCGLFVPTPDSRTGHTNDVCLIPVSDPRLLSKETQMQYHFIGVFLGVCIRSSIVQRINFAPLVWNFLATGTLSIDDIFEIDNQYKHLITSLEEVMNNYKKENEKGVPQKTEEDFQELFDLKFVVTNSKGEEVPLTQRGRFEKVTLANCSDYISMANEFRLNEIRPNLEEMREGLWENLNIKPPAFVSGKLLENAACGTKELTYEALKRIITFNNVPYNQQQFILKVIKNFSSKERSLFLKFITGRVLLPRLEIIQDEISSTKNGSNSKMIDDFIIKVDKMKGQIDKLPTASTCFNQLHIPEYSSYDKAKEMISIAIKYTGTFENR